MLTMLVSALVNIAFITLLERKILGLNQNRLGPNKVSIKGLLQPLADAFKLFLTSWEIPFSASMLSFLLGPAFATSLVFTLWALSPMEENKLKSPLSGLVLLMIISMNVYPLIYTGWASNNKYSMVGALRGVAQTISYEISLALILCSFLIPFSSLNLLTSFLTPSFLVVGTPVLAVVWMAVMVAETGRTPFDFAEGESELVSGFNVEYGGGGFAMIFMAEYGMIIFLSTITAMLMFGSTSLSSILSLILIYFWLWIRGTFPRYRYDLLMHLSWKLTLPVSLSTLFFMSIFLI